LALAADTNDYNKCFILIADIDLDPNLPGGQIFTTAVIALDIEQNWYFDAVAFTGVFDGAGHKISDLTINNDGTGNECLGLFGGIAGGGEIKNLRLANVSITSGEYSSFIGGLAGWNSGGKISNCYSTGAVTGGQNAWDIGGLVGYTEDGSIINCYSTCNVIGGDESVGLGGLAGCNYSTISNCYSTGAILGGDSSHALGGLIGINHGSIISCYFLNTSGPNNGFGTPLTDAQMKQQASFVGWDFINVWFIVEGVSYPQLRRYSGGLGTADDPYRIAKAVDLLTLAADANDYNKCFILTADINLASYSFTTALIAPRGGPAFAGVFDGALHKISNLTINTNGARRNYLGLFGYVRGEVRNLGIENVFVTGGNNSYCLGGLAGENDGTIRKCYSTGAIAGRHVSYDIGGLAGDNYGAISSCYSTCAVAGGDEASCIGGLTGYNGGGISDCYATGAVAGGNGAGCLGGLAGFNDGSNIANCYATGAVTGGDGSEYLGGLVGYNYNNGNVGGCYFLVTSGPDNGFGTPLTDEQMKQQTSFVGWDFIMVWSIDEGVSYPQVRRSVKYSGGSGIPGNPYRIATAADLLALAADTGDYDKYFVLTADIDLDPNLPGNQIFTTAVIAPDTDNTNQDFDGVFFTGVFDGAGHEITNLTINTNGAGNDYLGLFGGVAGGSFKNIRLENFQITTGASYGIGGLVGLILNGGGVSNCHVAGIITSEGRPFAVGGLAGGYYSDYGLDISNCSSKITIIISGDYSVEVGGLVGFHGFGSVSDCCSEGNIIGGTYSDRIGGLVGYDYGSISNCYSKCAVTGGDYSGELGGLVGEYNGEDGIIDCCSAGNVSGGNNSRGVGGLVGWGGHISGCSSTGNVTVGYSSDRIGGLAGVGSDTSNCCSTGTVSSGDSSTNVGGLVGYNGGGDTSNCHSTGDVNSGYDSEWVGGLMGYTDGRTISNCYSTGNVICGGDSFYLGGLAGWSGGTYITNCFSTGDVNAGAWSLGIGGLVGQRSGTIENCYSTGAVTGGDFSDYLGGLAGYSSGRFNYCYSTGAVTGGDFSDYLGGLAGYNGNTITNCYATGAVTGGEDATSLGGLVGVNRGGSISNCYSVGIVIGGINSYGLGGLAGGSDSTISGCYFLITSGPNNHCGTPLTDAQMKQQASFVGWDFNDVWQICKGAGYPKLLWETPPPCVPYLYSGGTGEPNAPYQIAGTFDLLALAANLDDYNKCFVLTVDMNLAPLGALTTAVIASGEETFTGVFDGAGHKITNLTINTSGARKDYLGLFGYVSGGEIKNLGLENVSITDGNDSNGLGGLVGYNNGGTISNCYSTGNVTAGGGSYNFGGLVGYNYYGDINDCYSTGAVTGHSSLGGLVGYNYHGNISDCCSTGAVTGDANSHDLGGLVGDNYGNITNCYSTGVVTGGSGSYNLGGLVGSMGYRGYSGGIISNCYSTGAVTGGGALGGLVGSNYGSISDCYSTGAITGDANSHDLGGLVGDNDNTISNCYSTGAVTGGGNSGSLGGLVGYNDTISTISNCYSTGAVNGGGALGGLIGQNGSCSTISNCYSTGTVTGGGSRGGLIGWNGCPFGTHISSCYFLITSGPDNGLGTPLTDEQMKQQSSFVGWNFNDVWQICETTNYPKLIWQIPQADFICPDGVNFVDYGLFANWWGAENCAANKDCDGADLTGNGVVDIDDLVAFSNDWLSGF
jgi:hypothetical protein